MLYEVITDQFGHAGMSGAAGGGGGFGGGFSMEDIFSQFGDIFGGHFGGAFGDAFGVITSYSIHYTKLYDQRVIIYGDGLRRVAKLCNIVNDSFVI